MKQKKEKFPPADLLNSAREKLSNPNYNEGNLAFPENSNQIDLAKYEICQMIAKYQRKNNLLQKEIAKIINVDESRVSDILRGKIEGFTLDRLVSYAEKLDSSFKIKIIAA